jgi:hypothetical protein
VCNIFAPSPCAKLPVYFDKEFDFQIYHLLLDKMKITAKACLSLFSSYCSHVNVTDRAIARHRPQHQANSTGAVFSVSAHGPFLCNAR